VETKRLDILLVERGLVTSRERAQARIMAKHVLVDGRPITKSGAKVPLEAKIVLRGEDLPYVSRGGLKLEKAITAFALDLNDKIVLDVGASTGGFTDCVLQNGARKVYAVDVGYGQLAWRLRQDPRVIVLERTNIRHLDKSKLIPFPSMACIDVSFISLQTVIPPVMEFLVGDRELVALIKPQFEVGRSRVGKGGIVREPSLHREVLSNIVATVEQYLTCIALDYSPIRGSKGNIEYLLYARLSSPKLPLNIDQVVANAHADLT
jgi:23S rRNA (cytidine1920-2'-O)/16S rRNA (cytidine1409-2'-O)-methyltransferase